MERGLEGGLAGEALLVADHAGCRLDDGGSKALPDWAASASIASDWRSPRCRAAVRPAHASATARIRLPRGIASAGRPAGKPSPAQRSRAWRARKRGRETSASPPCEAAASRAGRRWRDEVGGAGELAALGARDVEHVGDRRRVEAHRVGASRRAADAAARDPLERGLRDQDHERQRRQRDTPIVSTRTAAATPTTSIPSTAGPGRRTRRGSGRRSIALVEGREGEPREAEVDHPHRDADRVERGAIAGPVGEPASASSRAPTSTASAKLPTLATKPGQTRLLEPSTKRAIRSGNEPDQEGGERPGDGERDEGDDEGGAEEDAVAGLEACLGGERDRGERRRARRAGPGRSSRRRGEEREAGDRRSGGPEVEGDGCRLAAPRESGGRQRSNARVETRAPLPRKPSSKNANPSAEAAFDHRICV